jgi:hypothetical protein
VVVVVVTPTGVDEVVVVELVNVFDESSSSLPQPASAAIMMTQAREPIRRRAIARE